MKQDLPEFRVYQNPSLHPSSRPGAWRIGALADMRNSLTTTTEPGTIAHKILTGDLRAVARAISRIENGGAETAAILRGIYAGTGRGLTIGITGPPGAGKSSLVDRLAAHYRASGLKVGILAVDPSSPFSGGAILGDRIRMQSLSTDPGIFIRSMATRGNLGGLARATIDSVAVLDAAGYDRILVETVGVGQDEIDIVRAADVTLVVLVPGMGDDIQAIKAGIMEIGDLFAINKAEREGVERMERELLASLEMSVRPDGWHPPIIRTVATRNQGIDSLAEAIDRYAAYRKAQPAATARNLHLVEHRLHELLREELLRIVLGDAIPADDLAALVGSVARRELDPYTAVGEMLRHAGLTPTMQREAGRDAGMRGAMDLAIQHLGVAVSSIEESLKFWRDGLGLELKEVELVEDQGVRVAILPIGESRIELLEATGDETPVGRFLARRGAGLHHLCLEVDNLATTLDSLKKAGIRLIDEQPRIGAGGALVAFVHPQGTGGVLLELTQKGTGHGAPAGS